MSHFSSPEHGAEHLRRKFPYESGLDMLHNIKGVVEAAAIGKTLSGRMKFAEEMQDYIEEKFSDIPLDNNDEEAVIAFKSLLEEGEAEHAKRLMRAKKEASADAQQVEAIYEQFIIMAVALNLVSEEEVHLFANLDLDK